MSAMKTEELIAKLAADVRPVRRLPSPPRRVSVWLAAGLPYLALVVLMASPRDDLAAKLTEARFLVEQGAAFATAVLAAIAAFSLGIPGRSRWWAALPLPAVGVWLASLGQGCWRAWFELGAEGLVLRPDFVCFPAIVAAGAVPGVVMVLMLRRGAPLSPRLTVMLGALAAAALGDVGLRLFHPQDASLTILVWQFGTVALLSLLGTVWGPRLLVWRRIATA